MSPKRNMPLRKITTTMIPGKYAPGLFAPPQPGGLFSRKPSPWTPCKSFSLEYVSTFIMPLKAYKYKLRYRDEKKN